MGLSCSAGLPVGLNDRSKVAASSVPGRFCEAEWRVKNKRRKKRVGNERETVGNRMQGGMEGPDPKKRQARRRPAIPTLAPSDCGKMAGKDEKKQKKEERMHR